MNRSTGSGNRYEHATPEARGHLLAILCETEPFLDGDPLSTLLELSDAGTEHGFALVTHPISIWKSVYEPLESARERAILHVLRWVQSPRELWEVCESMTIRDTIGGEANEDERSGLMNNEAEVSRDDELLSDEDLLLEYSEKECSSRDERRDARRHGRDRQRQEEPGRGRKS